MAELAAIVASLGEIASAADAAAAQGIAAKAGVLSQSFCLSRSTAAGGAAAKREQQCLLQSQVCPRGAANEVCCFGYHWCG